MQIQTLADILAGTGTQPAKKNKTAKAISVCKSSENRIIENTVIENTVATNEPIKSKPKTSKSKKSKKQKKWHPAAVYQADTTHIVNADGRINQQDNQPILSVKQILNQVKNQSPTKVATDTTNLNAASHVADDNLPAALTAYLKTPEQREAEKEQIKADSRLRWLAFYYLSTREHSRQELKDKLIAKEQDPDKVEALLDEFAEKGYQSEQRTAVMLIKEGIRKGRGRRRIEQDFRHRKIDIPANIDDMIELAQSESQSFADYVDDDSEQIDWLKLAVEARVKKYGDAIPTCPKDKAKQLRFLQYRGYMTDICYQAIKLNLQNLDDIF